MASVFGGWWRLALVAACGLATLAGCGESFVSTTGSGGAMGGGGAGAGTPTTTTGGTSSGGGGAGGGSACSDGDKLACYTGPADTRHVGACADGQKQCDNGQWGPCEGQTLPAAETCDGQDNDCDTAVDEDAGCTCTDGDPCFPFGGMAQVGKGDCKAGEKVCEGGQQSDCQGAVGPKEEVCNGFDDDCDGVLDDVDGIGNACNTGKQGVCAAGKMHCNVARQMLDCAQDTQPGEETCNQLDDDCDGLVDNLAAQACQLQAPGPNGQNVQCNGQMVCGANQAMCGPKIFFQDDFSNPVGAGWSFNEEWNIAPAMAGAQPGMGNPDPALDHTSSPDNGVAGVVVGGNAPQEVTVGSYLTSKQIMTAGFTTLYLTYWRWLNAPAAQDAPHSVQVSTNNGATWTSVWANNDGQITDNQWKLVVIDLSMYAGQSIRVRFGYSLTNVVAPSFSGWNIDDVVVASCPVASGPN